MALPASGGSAYFEAVDPRQLFLFKELLREVIKPKILL
jgi:hypothetical protein